MLLTQLKVLGFSIAKSLRVQKPFRQVASGGWSFSIAKSLRVQKHHLVIRYMKASFSIAKSLRVQKPQIKKYLLN